jgi:hypothetical protein
MQHFVPAVSVGHCCSNIANRVMKAEVWPDLATKTRQRGGGPWSRASGVTVAGD